MQYQINIKISPAGLQQIYAANQLVTLAKTSSDIPGGFPLVWLTFQPFQLNQIVWNEDYSLYVTGTPLTLGSVITINSLTNGPAQLGWLYAFKSGFFQGQEGQGVNYSAANQTSSTNPLGFGLAQSANVNGVSVLSPVNAVSLPVNQQVAFTPQEKVSIFLSSSGNGTIIDSLPGNVLTVTLTPQNPVANAVYDDSAKSFKQVSENLAPSGPAGEKPKIGLEFVRSLTAA